MSVPKSIANAVDRARSASREERAFAGRAWVGAFAIEASLALVGLQKTLRWVESVPLRRRGSNARLSAAKAERAVNWAYRVHPLRGTCLPRALVQYLLQRRDGAEVRFVVGVRRDRQSGAPEAGLAAHAWVEEFDAARSEPSQAGFSSLLVSQSNRPLGVASS